MNLKRLLDIAQEADKIGDYVTADKVTNLLKTAQGQYSVYPSQAAYDRTPQQSQQMQRAQQQPQEKQLFDQLFQRIQNAHKIMGPGRQREILDIQSQIDNNSTRYPSLRNLQSYLSMDKMNAKNTNYQIQNYEQQKRLDQIEKVKYIAGMPSNYQPAPVSTYYAPMAAGATYYTPGVVNAAPTPMTEQQRLDADMRGLKGQVYQANQVARQNAQQPRQYPIYQTAPAQRQYQQMVYPGNNTEGPFQANPNAPINPNLYGTGYASMAMMPQTYQAGNNQNYNQNYNTPMNQNSYNAGYPLMRQQQQQQSFPLADHSRDFYFESDNGGPIDQSMNVAFGTQNKTPTSSTPYPFR